MAPCGWANANAEPGRAPLVDIPAGPLARSLGELSRQTGLSVGLSGAMPAVRAPHVHGRMSGEAALARLLAGSGWRAEPIGPALYRLVPAPSPSRRAPDRPPAGPISGDIIVTAGKRDQPLAALPLSLAVVSAPGERGASGLAQSRDVAERIEGLSFTNLGPGRNRPFIRGIADSPFNGPSQSTVAVELDDQRITYSAPDPDLRLVDIDRVEVLKGPQGPLHGTGALGGVYHLVTRRPRLDRAEGAASAYGDAVNEGGAGGGGSAVVNLPLSADRLALRAVGYVAREPGWVDNPGRDNVNRGRVHGGRIALRARPFAGWTIDLAAVGQWQHMADSQYVETARRALRRDNRSAEPQDNDVRLASARIEGAVRGATLVASLGITGQDVSSRYDAGLAAAAFGRAGDLLYDETRRYTVVDGGLRLSRTLGNGLSWLGGVSILSARDRQRGTVRAPGSAARQTVLRASQQATEIAAFAEIDWPLASTLVLTTGARLFRSSTENERDTGGAAGLASIHKTGFSPSLALAWRPRPDRLVFLRYAAALRPGGLSLRPGDGPARFKSDELAALELGTRWPVGGGVRLDASLFGYRWQDVQSDDLLASGLVATRNAGDAGVIGGEASLRWTPASRWSAELGAIVQHARLTDPAAGVATGDDNRLPVVPDLAAHAAIERRFGWRGWQGTFGATLSYGGSARLSFDPGLDRHMGEIVRIGLDGSLARHGWRLGAEIANLLDSRGDSFAFGNPFSVRAQRQYTPQPPRRLTISLRRQW